MAKDIRASGRVDGMSIRVNASLSGDVQAGASLGQTVIQYVGDSNPYTGSYTIDPDFDGQVLQTRQKYMTDNVTVNPIQVESVSNIEGGRTVYIGGII